MQHHFIRRAVFALQPLALAAGLCAQGPTVTLWHGDTQSFGALGNAQQWVNVLGRVSDSDGVAALSYRLNGGPSRNLSVGADLRRLWSDGDFNIDIDHADLVPGANTIAISARDTLGNVTNKNVTIQYTAGQTWTLPWVSDWSAVSQVYDTAQVVDGEWAIAGGALRPTVLGYDRVVAIGDENWTDYVATVPFRFEAISGDPRAFQFPSVSPGFGVTARWIGHTERVAGEQPLTYWLPQGGGPWFDAGQGDLYLAGSDGMFIPDPQNRQLVAGSDYVWKIRAESLPNGDTFYGFKMWEAGQAEPTLWEMHGTEGPIDLQHGSLILVAHHTDISVGDVAIEPIAGETTAPVLVGVQAATTAVTASILWSTDEPATSTVYYGTDPSYGLGSVSSSDLRVDHLVNLTNLSAGQTYHYRVESVDGRGNVATTGDRTFTTNSTSGIPPSALADDEFNGSQLDPNAWGFLDPLGDNSITMTGTQLQINVSGAQTHDAWTSSNHLPRVMRQAPTGDFAVEAKFDSNLSGSFSSQGILIEQDPLNVLRVEFHQLNRSKRLFVAGIFNGSATIHASQNLPVTAPMWLRVTRTGDFWVVEYSFDGTNFQTGASFTKTMAATAVGVYGGNSAGTSHTVLVDYFRDVSSGGGGGGNPGGGGAGNAGLQSDTFDAGSLDPRWQFVDPLGDATLTMTGSQAQIRFASTAAHDAWTNSNTLPRIRQACADGDFDVEVKFDGSPTDSFQSHGILLEQTDTDVIRVEMHTWGGVSKLFVCTIFGSNATVITSDTITIPTPARMRVVRSGDAFTVDWSADGTNWSRAASFTQPMTLTHVSLYGGGDAPFDALFDAFVTDGVGTGSGGGGGNPGGGGGGGGGATGGPVSDDFNQAQLDGRWTFVDPLNDSSVSMTGTAVQIAVPGTAQAHDAWTESNTLPRIAQDIADVDFDVSAKFDAAPSAHIQSQGILIEQTDLDFVRVETHHYQGQTKLFVASVFGGSYDIHAIRPVALGASTWLRVERNGDNWTVQMSGDGQNWGNAVAFSQPMTATRVSLYAGNSPNTAFTTTIDAFIGDGTPGGGGGGNPGGGGGSTLQNDEFDAATINTSLWTFKNPFGDASIVPTGTHAEIYVPGTMDRIHDVWTMDNTLPRLMQDVGNEDFTVETKFDSTFNPAAGFQSQGLLVEQSELNVIRIEFHKNYDGTQRVFVATIFNGRARIQANQVINPTGPMHLRVTRAGTSWTVGYSFDGQNYTTATNFSQGMQVNEIGPYAGGGDGDAFTARVDWFHVY